MCQTPGRLSEEVKCRSNDPLQNPVIYQSDGIEAEDSEIQDRELTDQSDRLAQGAGKFTDGGDAKDKSRILHQCVIITEAG